MGPCARASSTIARADADPRGGARQPARASRARVQPPLGRSRRMSAARVVAVREHDVLGSRRTSTADEQGGGACSSAARCPRQGPPGAGRAQASALPRWRAGCCPASRESTLAEAEKPQVDELIRAGGCARRARRTGRDSSVSRTASRRSAGRQDPESGRPAHGPSRRASARGASELMMRASRPRVTKLNAQLMSTSRRFWKPTR